MGGGGQNPTTREAGRQEERGGVLEFQRKDERRANSHRREGDSEGKVDRSLMLYELFP